ncbi:MAG: hypothetical protein FWE38_05325 [Firmicutes bacterium]|nr:hypothetical protein [Bacillota bacterium]
MWLAILSGLIVSVDALFIGISFGTQKGCRAWHVLVINTFLIALCFVGYIIAISINLSGEIDIDLIIGSLFIALGLWVISQCRRESGKAKNIVMTGLFMSVEAMLITMGLTFILDVQTIWIPLTVGLAHLGYSMATFFLARYLRRLPHYVGHLLSGIALVTYGLMAILL